MDSVSSSIDTLRREMRHDLREMRATLQAVMEAFAEDGKQITKLEGNLALMQQRCDNVYSKLAMLKGEFDVLEAEVSRLKADKQRLTGSWQALTLVGTVAAGLSAVLIKWVGA